MLAYRHAFHAGNHGDVLKHAVLVAVLHYMLQKETAVSVIDTHAGAGLYALGGRHAARLAEHSQGIGALWGARSLPALLRDYVDIVARFNAAPRASAAPRANVAPRPLSRYPGSPALALALLRGHDRLRLHELHPTDERALRGLIARPPHPRDDPPATSVTLGDGFAALARELPPPSRRGLVLIDPSYELKADYPKTLAALRTSIERFATGTVIVWYPQVQRLDARQLPKRLVTAAGAAPKGFVHATLTLTHADREGFGMTGSGVLVVNPPYTLAAQLREALPWLVTHLGQTADAKFTLDEGRGTSP